LPKPRPRTVDVEIYDQKYSIVLKSDMQEADVRRIAEDVDQRMREISAAANSADSLKVAVLAALHLAQELREQRKSSEQNDVIIRKKSDEWSHVLEQLLNKAG
jgi:cell division protein ZapA